MKITEAEFWQFRLKKAIQCYTELYTAIQGYNIAIHHFIK